MNVLSLIAQLGLDGSRFKAGLKEAEVASNRFTSNVSRDVGRRLTGAFSATALAYGSKRIIDFNSNIKDTATALDISTDSFQEQAYWLTQNGVNADALTAAYKGLAKARAEALGGNNEKMGLFELMGIDADELQSGSIENLFKRVSESFRTTDFGADKMAVAADLFGRAGTQLLPALEESLASAAGEAHKFGQVISKDVVASLEGVGDEIDKLTRSVMTEMSTMLNAVIKGLRNAFTYVKLFVGTGASFAGGLSTGSMDAATSQASQFWNKTLEDWEKMNESPEKSKKTFRGSAYLEDPDEPKAEKEKSIRDRVAKEAIDRGEPGRVFDVSSLTRMGQLSGRDSAITGREPVEKLVDMARQALLVEKEQAATLKLIEQKKVSTITGHY